MNEWLVENKSIAIAFIVVVVALALILLAKIMQHIGLEKVRAYVYKLFVEAEHEFAYGDNQEKFDYVINLTRDFIPMPFSLFITESLLRKVVQAWFDLCKDLLDDGKLNKSEEEGV